MVVSDTVAAVEFLRAVFGALGEVPADRPAEMRIGDSLIMVSSAGEREAFPAFLAVYVNDVYVDIHVDTADAAYHQPSRQERRASNAHSTPHTATGGPGCMRVSR